MSTKPGASASPSSSTTSPSVASPVGTTAAIRSPSITTSPDRPGAPVPSTTSPPRRINLVSSGTGTHPAAVDEDRLTGDVARSVGRQEHGGTDDFVGPSDPAHRDLVQQRFPHWAHRSFGVDGAWADAV